MTQESWNVVQKSSTFGLNETSVLHNQSCGLVVDESLREWQGMREWAEEWCCTKPNMNPSTWMNEQWTTTTVCCVRICVWVCVCAACVSLEAGRQCWCWCEVLSIVPKGMQCTDWRQFEEWQERRCKCLHVCVCATLDAASLNSGVWRKALTHPQKEKRALCVFCFL